MKSLLLNETEKAIQMTKRLVDLKDGCESCGENIQRLNDSIYKQKFDLKTGGYSPLPIPADVALEGFFGSKNTNTILTENEIEAGTPFSYFNQDDVEVPFNVSVTSWYWFAIGADQTIKNIYEDAEDPGNEGLLGSSSDLMDSPTLVGDYYFYITNYPTIQTNPLKFKNS